MARSLIRTVNLPRIKPEVVLEKAYVSQELKLFKNEETHEQKWQRSLKSLSSIKEVRKLEKRKKKKKVRIKFLRILEINQRLVAIWETFIQEIS